MDVSQYRLWLAWSSKLRCDYKLSLFFKLRLQCWFQNSLIGCVCRLVCQISCFVGYAHFCLLKSLPGIKLPATKVIRIRGLIVYISKVEPHSVLSFEICSVNTALLNLSLGSYLWITIFSLLGSRHTTKYTIFRLKTNWYFLSNIFSLWHFCSQMSTDVYGHLHFILKPIFEACGLKRFWIKTHTFIKLSFYVNIFLSI